MTRLMVDNNLSPLAQSASEFDADLCTDSNWCVRMFVLQAPIPSMVSIQWHYVYSWIYSNWTIVELPYTVDAK